MNTEYMLFIWQYIVVLYIGRYKSVRYIQGYSTVDFWLYDRTPATSMEKYR